MGALVRLPSLHRFPGRLSSVCPKSSSDSCRDLEELKICTQLIGLQAAMDAMLTGKDIRPDKAKKMGLVDMVVTPASLEDVAIGCAADLSSGKLKAKRKPKSWMNRLIEDTSFGRNMMWKQVEKLVEKNTGGNYPAPYSIIEAVKHGLDNPSNQIQERARAFCPSLPQRKRVKHLLESLMA